MLEVKQCVKQICETRDETYDEMSDKMCKRKMKGLSKPTGYICGTWQIITKMSHNIDSCPGIKENYVRK
jgi:hypothetical protein